MTVYDWPQAARDVAFYLSVMGSVVGAAHAFSTVVVAVIARIANR